MKNINIQKKKVNVYDATEQLTKTILYGESKWYKCNQIN